MRLEVLRSKVRGNQKGEGRGEKGEGRGQDGKGEEEKREGRESGEMTEERKRGKRGKGRGERGEGRGARGEGRKDARHTRAAHLTLSARASGKKKAEVVSHTPTCGAQMHVTAAAAATSTQRPMSQTGCVDTAPDVAETGCVITCAWPWGGGLAWHCPIGKMLFTENKFKHLNYRSPFRQRIL